MNSAVFATIEGCSENQGLCDVRMLVKSSGQRLRRHDKRLFNVDPKLLDPDECFDYCRNTEITQHRMQKKQTPEKLTRYADMFSAMGAEARLRIMQLLLSAHPDGLIVGEIGNELKIPSSTLSHHLDKLKNEDLVNVRREGTCLWYSANIDVLQELLEFLYAECCARNRVIEPRKIVSICK